MNFRQTLVTNAVNNLTVHQRSINPELKGILNDLASGQYTADTLPTQKFNALNLASEAINDRRLINQNNKYKKEL